MITMIENMVGQRYNRLTVINQYFKMSTNRKRNLRDTWVQCQCDCGNIKDVIANAIRTGNTTSCGCFKTQNLKEHPNGKQLNHGQAAFNSLYSNYKRGTKNNNRNYEFQLTSQQFAILTRQPCTYCGIEPSQVHRLPSCNGDYIYNGIDRVNNDLGYTFENCVSACGVCNYAKDTMTLVQWNDWIKRIVNHNKELV